MNLISAKIYNDGGHYIAIPHTQRRHKRRNASIPLSTDEKKKVEILEEQFNKVKGKRETRKAKVLQECAPLFENQEKADKFVEKHFNRLSRNRWERYKRMIRRGYNYGWNFFCTFTYNSEKHTEEGFRESLMNTLYHLSSRRGWRYIGAWERGELGERMHFHALAYIPENSMPGVLEEHEDYSTKRHKREKSIQNSYFNGRFGRSDFSEIVDKRQVADSIKYMLKYISKNDEKIVYSRGMKTYFVSDVLDEDILCQMGDEEHGFKYILADDFTCISEGEIMGKVNYEVIEKMPKSN